MFFWVVILAVLSLSGMQVYNLAKPKVLGDDPEVLAVTTEMTLEDRVAALENRLGVVERYTGVVKPVVKRKTKEQYVTLAGGKITGNEWSKIGGSDFTFDGSLYGSSVEVSWQGWIESGYGSVRLYDSTNHRVVDNSEMNIDSGVRSSFYSKPISIWRGQNQYYIEGKNPHGEMILSSPRLRVVTR